MKNIILPKCPRRNRKTEAIRELIAETFLTTRDLIAPFFVTVGVGIKEEIRSLPGVYRWSVDLLLEELENLYPLGLRTVMLFPVVPQEMKDDEGSYALIPNNILCLAIKKIKTKFPQLCVISSLSLDLYTSDGRRNIVLEDQDMKSATMDRLGEMALLHAEMGADVVSPNGMIDGQVANIRSRLDSSGYEQTSILSYSVKYDSSLYTPFREALGSSILVEDTHVYQMDPRNSREAFIETALDEEEGADMLMISPVGMYLDILSRMRKFSSLPLIAYQASGEYTMLATTAAKGFLDFPSIILESLIAIKRAGANAIVSYATPFLLENSLIER